MLTSFHELKHFPRGVLLIIGAMLARSSSVSNNVKSTKKQASGRTKPMNDTLTNSFFTSISRGIYYRKTIIMSMPLNLMVR